jgi:dihydroorotase-like cyclic amidohydrolase
VDRADLVVKNGTVVTSAGMVAADLAIAGGRFVAIAAPGALAVDAAAVYDAAGLHVLPGVIDGHVHFQAWSTRRTSTPAPGRP